jgi:hypothetical protein
VRELIDTAMQQVEGDDWYKMGMDDSTVCRDKLADLLQERVEDLMADVGDFGESGIGSVGPSVAYLWQPILNDAMAGIDFSVVAHALLLAAGKWAPDRDAPEVK